MRLSESSKPLLARISAGLGGVSSGSSFSAAAGARSARTRCALVTFPICPPACTWVWRQHCLPVEAPAWEDPPATAGAGGGEGRDGADAPRTFSEGLGGSLQVIMS